MKIAWLPQDEKSASERIVGMNLFRALAAMAVFATHFWYFSLQDKFGESSFSFLFSEAHIGVDLFFLLSGFLVFLSFVRTEKTMIFFEKRFLRVLPLFYTILLIIFLLGRNFSWEKVKILFLQLGFVHTFFIAQNDSILRTSWSLEAEMFFYLSLPLLAFVARRRIKDFFALLAVGSILSFLYRICIYTLQFSLDWNWQKTFFIMENFFGHFDQFSLGILIALFWIFVKQKSKKWQRFRIYFVISGIAIVLIAMKIFALLGGDMEFRKVLWAAIFLRTIVAFGFFLLIIGFLCFRITRIPRILAPINFLGEISYGIYLWHLPILSVLTPRIPNPVLGFFAVFGSTLIVSSASYFLIERPFLRRKKKF